MPYRDKPTLHKRQGIYYLSAGDAYSTASSVYGPYTYRGTTGAGGSHGRFFTWNAQWFRGFVVQIHAPWPVLLLFSTRITACYPDRAATGPHLYQDYHMLLLTLAGSSQPSHTGAIRG